MALDFGILQPANISGQLQAGQESAMRNQLAQQQLAAGQQQMETGRMQQEKAGLEMQQFRRRQSALDKFLSDAEKGGHTGDPEDVAKSFFNFAITNGDPSVVMAAQQALMAAKERKAYIASRTPGAPAMPVAPAGSEDRLGDFISQIEAKQNAPMPMPAVTGRPIQPEQALNVVSRSEGSPSPIPTANMLAPAAAAPANALAAPVDPAAALQAKIIDLETRYPSGVAKNEIARLTKQLDDMQKSQIVAPGASVFQGGRAIYTAPERPPAPPSSIAEFDRARTDPAFMRFLQDRAAATRAPIQPVAPTITQIVDPTDPNKMITIDARRYQGGGAGSPGVIGVSGKEPSAALRENKTEAGKTQLADDLENLRFSFQKLDSLRAIPSTERNALSNVTSGLASTAIGQKTGQLFATEAQVERDVINSARSRLVNSIKNATGMSAQQLNSNVELQTMLKSISDPGQSYQSAIRIIEDIEDAYVKGKGMKKRGEPAPAPAATQGTGGFKYLGKESTK